MVLLKSGVFHHLADQSFQTPPDVHAVAGPWYGNPWRLRMRDLANIDDLDSFVGKDLTQAGCKIFRSISVTAKVKDHEPVPMQHSQPLDQWGAPDASYPKTWC